MGGGTATRSGSTASRLDDEYMEKIMNKVCGNFIKQLEEKIDAKLDSFENRINDNLNKVNDTLKKINDGVMANKKEIDNLKVCIENLEQQYKRNSLRLCGLEEKEDENLEEMVPRFIKESLNVTCSREDLDYVFRLSGGPDNNNPKAIIISFVSNIKRNEVFKAKRLLKNTPVTIFEDLTRSKYELLRDVKKKYGNTNVWSSSG